MSEKTMKKTLTIAIAAVMAASCTAVTAFAAENTATANEINPGNYQYTIVDATKVQKALTKIKALTEHQEYLYDIDGVSGITINDATKIQKIVAKISDQPTYHEEAGYTTIDYLAEYKTVEVTDEETTKKVATYVYDCRCICYVCGEDITDILRRYDTAVANGEVVPGDGMYEKMKIIDGHYYYGDYSVESDGHIEYIFELKNSDGIGMIDDYSYHIDEDGGVTGETGWYGSYHWLYYGTSTYVTGDNLAEIERYLGDGERQTDYPDWEFATEKYTNLADASYPNADVAEERDVIYTTVTVPASTHTEQVLVKEAYTEQVLVPGGRWY